MAIAFRQKSSADLTATGTTSITKPTGFASTDILICQFGFGGARTYTAPAGWTAIATQVGDATIRGSCWWALGSVANLSFTIDSGTGDMGWVCAAYTGVDNTTPIDATGTTGTNTNSGTIVANLVTVATANAWELIASIAWQSGAWSATGFTSADNGSAANQQATILYNTTPKSTGSTGTVTVTNAGTASGQHLIAIPFALRPVAGTETITPDKWFARQDVPLRPRNVIAY
jgi:hypothetical protein